MSKREESKRSASTSGAGKKMVGMDFEIAGKVQGVFFRKHTRITAQKLGLVGWVMNMTDGSRNVVGQAFGPPEQIAKMKTWLSSKGSPKSRIDKATFSKEGPVSDVRYKKFTIRR